MIDENMRMTVYFVVWITNWIREHTWRGKCTRKSFCYAACAWITSKKIVLVLIN